MYKFFYDALYFGKSKRDNAKLIQGLKGMDYDLWGYMENCMRETYKCFTELLLQAEQYELIKVRRDEGLDGDWLYRNGMKNITITTRLGRITIKRPQLRKSYESVVLPKYSTKEQALIELITDLYTLGISTDKMSHALKRLLGASFSASSVSTMTNHVIPQLTAFHRRTIEDKYVYLYFDGIPMKAKHTKWEKKKGHMVLVAYGVTSAGIKEIIDFRIAKSESNEQCAGFIFDLYERGLKGKCLKLVITDGAKGFHNALDEIYSHVLRQRCWVHKLRNVAHYLNSKEAGMQCLVQAKKIYLAKNRKQALKRFKRWKKDWENQFQKAVVCLEQDLSELLNFFYFPEEHRVKIRTTNPIERAFREFRRRTKVMDNYLPNMASCEKIFFVLTEYLNKRWKAKKFLHFPAIDTISAKLPRRKAA